MTFSSSFKHFLSLIFFLLSFLFSSHDLLSVSCICTKFLLKLIRSFFLPLSCDSFSSFPPSFFLYPYLDFFLASTFVFSFVVCLPDTFSSHQSHLYCCCLPTLCPKIPFSVFFFYSCHHPPPSMQQRSHQYEGAACEWQCSGGALGSSGGYLPPTHPPLPGVIQLDVTR